MKCNICSHSFGEVILLLRHLKIFHPCEAAYTCIYESCKRKFISVPTLKKHALSCKGKNEYKLVSRTVLTSDCNLSFDKKFQVDTVELTNNVPNAIELKCDKLNIGKHLIENSILSFIGKMYCNPALTDVIIQEIVSEFFRFVHNIINLFSNTLKSAVPVQYHNAIDKIGDFDIIDHLKTDYKRKIFLEKANLLIKPKKFLLVEIDDNKKEGDNIIFTKKQCYGYIVPIREILKQFLELPNVYKTVIDYIQTECAKDNCKVYTSIFPGKRWQSISTHFQGKVVIPLFLYFDEFEINNPLSTKVGIYKIGGLYFSLACLPPKFSSLIQNIFLGQFIFNTDLQEFKNKKCFKDLIAELQFLAENGILINIGGKEIRVFFIVIRILGDNLGLKSIFGFKQSFVSDYFCRICRVSKAQSEIFCEECESLLRTIDNYSCDAKNLSGGVLSVCVFNEIPFFNNLLNLVCDLMHDFLLGVARYDMVLIIKYFIQSKYFTLSNLNNRLKYFDYSECVSW